MSLILRDLLNKLVAQQNSVGFDKGQSSLSETTTSNGRFSGQFAFDGAGNISGTESGSIAGQIFTDQTVSGSYSVNSNCAGSATFQVSGQQSQHANLVVFNGGQNMYLIETDSNTTVAGEGQK